MARSDLFGDATKNAKYIFALEDEMRLRGHVVKIITTSKTKALNRLKIQILNDVMKRCEVWMVGSYFLNSSIPLTQ